MSHCHSPCTLLPVFSIAALLVVGLACGGTEPITPELEGVWNRPLRALCTERLEFEPDRTWSRETKCPLEILPPGSVSPLGVQLEKGTYRADIGPFSEDTVNSTLSMSTTSSSCTVDGPFTTSAPIQIDGDTLRLYLSTGQIAYSRLRPENSTAAISTGCWGDAVPEFAQGQLRGL